MSLDATEDMLELFSEYKTLNFIRYADITEESVSSLAWLLHNHIKDSNKSWADDIYDDLITDIKKNKEWIDWGLVATRVKKYIDDIEESDSESE